MPLQNQLLHTHTKVSVETVGELPVQPGGFVDGGRIMLATVIPITVTKFHILYIRNCVCLKNA